MHNSQYWYKWYAFATTLLLFGCSAFGLSISVSPCGSDGDRQEVLKACTAIIESNNVDQKKKNDAVKTRGIYYLDLKEYRKAIEDFNYAMKNSPNIYSLYFYRGVALHTQKKYDLAILDFTKSISLGNEYPHVYISRGKSYEKLGDLEKANLDYAKAKQIKLGVDIKD